MEARRASLSEDERPRAASVVSVETRLRLVLIGNSGVGKSAFLSRWCGDGFEHMRTSTIGIDSRQRVMESCGRSVQVQVLDTAGQERYMSVTPSYCRKADGVILVYDMFDLTSFKNVRFWKEQTERYAPENAKFLLLGSKYDDERSSSRVVTKDMGVALAKELGAPFFEVSAKTGKNIEKAMKAFVKEILTNAQQKPLLTCREEEVIRITGPMPNLTWRARLRAFCASSSARSSRNTEAA